MSFFTDGKDLEGITRPQDIQYMKYLRFFLIPIGGWPGKLFGEKRQMGFRYRCLNWILSVSTLLLGLIFVRNNIGKRSFYEMGQTYITVLMNSVCLSRFTTMLFAKYDKTLVEFVTEIHLFNHKDESEYSMKMNLFIHKLSYFFTVYTIVLVSSVATFFNLIPLANNISKGGFSLHPPDNITYEHSVYYALPFDNEHSFNGFIAVFTYNWYISYICAMMFLIYDLVVALIVFHLWGHLKILTYNLANFPRPGFRDHNAADKTYYSGEEISDVSQRLRHILNHHKRILIHCENISNTVGFSVAVYYIFHQVSGCLLLLECSQLETKALIRFGPLTICLINLLAQVSIIFELLSSMTDPLMRAAYEMPWECMDPKNRRLVLMLLRQTQIPLGLKAMGMVEVGVRTMASILKTTLSYFMMLRTMAVSK